MNRDELAEALYIGMAHIMNARMTAAECCDQACCAYNCADAFLAEKEKQAKEEALKHAKKQIDDKATAAHATGPVKK